MHKKTAGTTGKRKPTARKAKAASRRDMPSPHEVVETLLKRFSEKLEQGGDVTLTVNDFVRLLQLHKDFVQQEPREIEVRWVESLDCQSSEET